MKIDKNDAPKGAIAVEELDDCNGCMYYDGGVGCLMCRPDVKCCSDERRDGHDVIFKPAPKAYKRDSNGRFTSEQSERRKTMNREYMEKHFPAYTEAHKAMEEGQTITQTLGKKQAEIEGNAKHVQTNAEKYAKEYVVRILVEALKACTHDIHVFMTCGCDTSLLSGCLDIARSAIKIYTSQAAQDWPEWCKVGAWIAWENKGEMVFRKIESISAHQLRFFDGWNAEFEHVSRNYKPARVRPFTAKEAVDLVGKKIFIDGFNLKFAVTEVVFNENGCRVHRSLDVRMM